jgi:uncharacterized membrane protein YheB (UPF0754 family)
MNKSLITNIISTLLILIGFVLNNTILLTIGLFALSGAITNWLAIYMLFEKIPFLYGSGVVESRFEEFKLSIKNLMLEQFFTKENIDKFVSDNSNIDLSSIIDKTDFTIAFENLKDAIMQSSFGGMLGMFGGAESLNALKEPFELKMKESIKTIVSKDDFKQMISNNINDNNMHDNIESIIQTRLNQLDAKIVKNIILDMMKLHLQWLVVWGGFFGGMIGMISAFILTLH